MSKRLSLSEEPQDSPGPLRRSNRIITRRTSANSIVDSKLTNGEAEVEAAVEKKKTTRASIDAENRPGPIKGRRASTSKLLEEDKKLSSTPGTPSRRSTRILSTSPKKNDTPIRRTRSTSVDIDAVTEQLPVRRSTRRRSSVDIEEPTKEENLNKPKPVTRRRRSSSVDEIEENAKTDKSKPKLPLEPIEEQEAETKENSSEKKNIENVHQMDTIEKKGDSEMEESERIIKDIDEALKGEISTPGPKSAVPEKISSKSIFSPLTPKGTPTNQKSNQKIAMSGDEIKASTEESSPEVKKDEILESSENITTKKKISIEKNSKSKVLYTTEDDRIEKIASPSKDKDKVFENGKKEEVASKESLKLVINEVTEISNDNDEDVVKSFSSPLKKKSKVTEMQKNITNSAEKKDKKKLLISSGSDGSFTFNLNISSEKSKSQDDSINDDDEVFSSPGSNKENSSSNKMLSSTEKAKSLGSNTSFNVSIDKSSSKKKIFEPMDVDIPTDSQSVDSQHEVDQVKEEHKKSPEIDQEDKDSASKNDEDKSLSESTKSYISLADEEESSQMDKNKSFSVINDDNIESTTELSESPILTSKRSNVEKSKATDNEDSESDLSIRIVDSDEEAETEEKEVRVEEPSNTTTALRRSKRPRISDGTSKLIHKKLQAESGNERIGSISEDCETIDEEKLEIDQNEKDENESEECVKISKSPNEKKKRNSVGNTTINEKDISSEGSKANIVEESSSTLEINDDEKNMKSRKKSCSPQKRNILEKSFESAQNKSSDINMEGTNNVVSKKERKSRSSFKVENQNFDTEKDSDVQEELDRRESNKKKKSGPSVNVEKEEVNKLKSTPQKNKIKLDQSISDKLDELVSKKLEEDSAASEENSESGEENVNKSMSEDYENSHDEEDEDKTNFLDDMAEEGEEDTPSEGSNDIIDEGESIHSSDVEELQSDDSYDSDSFIVKDDENVELLSGEEYDLDLPDDPDKKKKKTSRILKNYDSSEDESNSTRVSSSEKVTVIDDKSPEKKAELSVEKKRMSSDKMADKSPLKMVEKSPLKMTDKSPLKMADKSPLKMTDKSPLKMADKSPLKVLDNSLLKVADKSPLKLANKSPMKVGGKSPMKVEGKTPMRVAGKSPMKVEQKVLDELRDKSPLKFANETPVKRVSPTKVPAKSPLKMSEDGSPTKKSGSQEESLSPRKLASNIIPEIEVDLIDDEESYSDGANEDLPDDDNNSIREKSNFEDKLRSIIEPEKSSTPNSSNATKIRRSSGRTSSIIVHENVSIDEIQDGMLVEKLQQVVRVFCSGIKASEGNVSMNVSLDYVENPKPSPEDEEVEIEESAVRRSLEEEITNEEAESQKISSEKQLSAKKRRLSLKSASDVVELKEKESIAEKKPRKSLEKYKNESEELNEEEITSINQSKLNLSARKDSPKKKRRSNLSPNISQEIPTVSSEKKRSSMSLDKSIQPEEEEALECGEDEKQILTKKQKMRKRNQFSVCEVAVEGQQSSKKPKKDEFVESVIELMSDEEEREDVSIRTKGKKSRDGQRLSSELKTKNSTPEFAVSKKMRLMAMKCEELSAEDLRHKLPTKCETIDGKSKIKQKKLKRLQSDLKRSMLSSLKDDLVTDVKNRSRRMLKPTVIMNSSSWIVEEVLEKPSCANLSKCTFNYRKFDAKDLKSQNVGKPSKNMLIGGKSNVKSVLDDRDFKNKMINDRRIKREDSAAMLRKKGYFL